MHCKLLYILMTMKSTAKSILFRNHLQVSCFRVKWFLLTIKCLTWLRWVASAISSVEWLPLTLVEWPPKLILYSLGWIISFNQPCRSWPTSNWYQSEFSCWSMQFCFSIFSNSRKVYSTSSAILYLLGNFHSASHISLERSVFLVSNKTNGSWFRVF